MSAETLRSILSLAVGIWIVAVLVLLPKPAWTKLSAVLRPLASGLNRNRFIASLVTAYQKAFRMDDTPHSFDNCDYIESPENDLNEATKR